MEFRILGPIEVRHEDRVLRLRAGKQRSLLAMLLVHANEVVTVDRLVHELWGSEAPPTAVKIVQNYISELRKGLDDLGAVAGDGRLETHSHGYRLRVEERELDVDRFESLLESGRRALAEGRPAEAADALRAALGLWRGPPLADLTFESFAQHEIARLEERRLAAIEDRIDADLALGRHDHLVGELETLVSRSPLRERLRAQLMIALYRCGRQAEALNVYRDARRRLVEGLGIEPSADLRRLEQAILNQHESLERPARASILSRSPRRRRLVVVTAAALLVAAFIAGVIVVRTARSEEAGAAGAIATPVEPNSVAVIDPKTNEVVAAVPVGSSPGPIAAGDGSIWVANVDDHTVSRIDPDTQRVVKTIGLGIEPTGLVVGHGAAWVAGGFANTLARIDTADGVVRAKLRIPNVLGPLPVGYERGPSAVAVGDGAVWLAHGREVSRIDPQSGTVVATIRAGGRWSATVAGSGAIATGDGAVWVADNIRRAISRIAPSSNSVVVEIPVVAAPSGIAVGEGGVWATFDLDESLWRIDPAANRVTRVIEAGDDVTRVAVGAGSVWAVNDENGVVTRFDPFSNRRLATINVGHRVTGVVVAADTVWVSVAELASG